MISDKTIENQLISRIYGNGRVWVFSKKDFASLGEPASIDRTLSRMAKKGLIRRVMRGLYDYPAYSKLLKKPLSPNIDQVAHALARKFGWQIQISGNAALNLMGLSTVVETQGPTADALSYVVKFTKGHHSSVLTPVATADSGATAEESAAATAEMQLQIATFLASRGQYLQVTNTEVVTE